jgi:hypothetical protein
VRRSWERAVIFFGIGANTALFLHNLFIRHDFGDAIFNVFIGCILWAGFYLMRTIEILEQKLDIKTGERHDDNE